MLIHRHYASPLQKRVVKYYDHTYRRLDYLTGMHTSSKSVKLRVSSKKEDLQKKYFELKNKITEQQELALEEFREADSMVKEIVDRYHLKPQNCKVDLFRSKDDDNYKLDSTHLRWKKAALKGIIIHNISGNHLGIVAPPRDKVLAKMIQNLLNEKHAHL